MGKSLRVGNCGEKKGSGDEGAGEMVGARASERAEWGSMPHSRDDQREHSFGRRQKKRCCRVHSWALARLATGRVSGVGSFWIKKGVQCSLVECACSVRGDYDYYGYGSGRHDADRGCHGGLDAARAARAPGGGSAAGADHGRGDRDHEEIGRKSSGRFFLFFDSF